MQYYPNGAVQQFVYGNGIVHQMQQNARQLPARSIDTGTLDLLTSFDVNGNVTAISDLVRGTGFDRQMQYDGNDRLTNAYSPAFGGDGWYRFGYDALDNLRTWTQPGEGQRRYNYDASNRLTLVSNAGGAVIIGLGYDVQGNLSIKNGQGYQFDFGNRLRQANGLERYRYDGHGRRSSVIDAGSGKNRHYLYSQGGALAYLWDQGTGETTQYIQLAGSLVATRTQAADGAVSVKYQHTDALGSPVAETNEQAAVVTRLAYTPYGASIGAAVDGVGYTGHVMDGSTGLTYMQQRYMDPAIGAFLSVDPVAAHTNPVGAFHRYRYGNGNPYRFVDLDGRQSVAACAMNPANATVCAEAGIATGSGASGAAGAGAGGSNSGGIIAGILSALGLQGVIQTNETAEAASQGAIDRIKDGTRPADGQAGKDGVLVGEGGGAGADAAINIAKGVDGAKVLVDSDNATVVQLPDGRKVESHISTKGGDYKGDRTVKIQDADGKVRPENIIRFPDK